MSGEIPTAGPPAGNPPEHAPAKPLDQPSGVGFLGPLQAYAARLLMAGGVAVLGAIAGGAGWLVHCAHLRMLGVPYFPLSPSSYGKVAVEFVVNSFWRAVWAKELDWIIAGVVTVLLLLLLAWAPSSRSRATAGWLKRYRPQAPRLYAAGMLVAVMLGGWLVARAGNALIRRDVVGLLWAFTGRDIPRKEHFEKLTTWECIRGLGPEDVRWCLFYRMYTKADGESELEKDNIRNRARAALGLHYGVLVRGTIVLLVWTVLAGRLRAVAWRVDTEEKQGSWTPLLFSADVLLGAPLVVILVMLLLLLPTTYGAIIKDTTCPVVWVPSNPENGLFEKSKPEEARDTDRAYLLSQPDHDAKGVCLVRPARAPYSGMWVVETRPLGPSWRLFIYEQVDILDDARKAAQLPEPKALSME